MGELIVVRGQAHDFLEASQIIDLISLHVPPPEDDSRNSQTVSVNRTSALPFGSQLGIGLEDLSNIDFGDLFGGQSNSSVINMLKVPGVHQVAL